MRSTGDNASRRSEQQPAQSDDTVTARRILVATTTPALGAGLQAWLEAGGPGWKVVAVLEDRAALERRLDEGAALLVASACLDGTLVVATAARAKGDVPLLVLVSEPDPQIEVDFLRAGAMAVLGVRTSREELVGAAASLMLGRCVVSAGAMHLLAEGPDPAPQFTDRQHEILCALAEGRSTKQIADDLVLTQSTVKTHIGRLAARLQLSGRQELEAAAAGLLAPGGVPSRRTPNEMNA